MSLFGFSSETLGSFQIFTVLFIIIFFGVLTAILSSAARGFLQFVRNEDSPELTVRAQIVTKRMNVPYRAGHGKGTGHSHTRCCVTFEVESGDRIELDVEAKEYGLLAEGDEGNLTFQGTRFLGFERNVKGDDRVEDNGN